MAAAVAATTTKTGVRNKTRSNSTYFLSHTMDNVKIYELENFQPKYELSREHEMMVCRQPQGVIVGGGHFCQNFSYTQEMIQHQRWDINTHILNAGFLPYTNKVYICLSNDTIQLWNWGFRTLRQTLHPLRIRQRYLRHCDAEQLNIFYDSDAEIVDDLVMNITQDTGKNVVADIQFSRNGVYCCVSLQYLNELIIFCISTITSPSPASATASKLQIPTTTPNPIWQVYKIIKLSDFPIATSKFISPWLPITHAMSQTTIDVKFLALQSTTSNELLLINADDLSRKVSVMKNCEKFVVAQNGKMLACICKKTGQILVQSVQYYTEKITNKKQQMLMPKEQKKKENTFGPMNRISMRLEKIHNEVIIFSII